MSIKSADALTQKLQQDLLNELITTNHLIQLISEELQEIKQLTRPGGEFDSNVSKNTALAKVLAGMHNVDLEKLPPLPRMPIDFNHHINPNLSYENRETCRIDSIMGEDK